MNLRLVSINHVFSRSPAAFMTAALISLCLCICTGCSESTGGSGLGSNEEYTQDIFAMDTTMTLTAYGSEAEEAVKAAVEEIRRLDDELSTGLDSSEISQLNETGEAVLSSDASLLVSRSLDIYESTGGLFDITVYPLMEAWGFTTKDYHVPSSERIDELLRNVGSDRIVFDKETGSIKLPQGVKIDLGGIAKGYTSSRVMDIFSEYEVDGGLVSLGGNVHLYKRKPGGSDFKIAIESPEDDAKDYAGILKVSDCAIITSGAYERFFEEGGVRYHHILDPRTGSPADSGLASVTIVSDDGTLADGLSTSLFIMGEEEAIEYWRDHCDEFDFALIRSDGTMLISQGISDIFETGREFEVVKK